MWPRKTSAIPLTPRSKLNRPPLILSSTHTHDVSPSPSPSPLLPPRTSHYPSEERRPTCSPRRPRGHDRRPSLLDATSSPSAAGQFILSLTVSFCWCLVVDFFHSLLIFASTISIVQIQKIVQISYFQLSLPIYPSSNLQASKAKVTTHTNKVQLLGPRLPISVHSHIVNHIVVIGFNWPDHCSSMASQERWCVVTGGRGFAARHLVDMLIRYEMFCVRVTDLHPSIKLEPHEEDGTLGKALKSGRAQYVSTDLRNKSQVVKACQGAEVVFHMAAPDSSINNFNLQYSVNVEGTKNVIAACVEVQVKRLIYTSSPSVVFDGIHGIVNGDESLSYPVKHNDSYSATKAEGEALVLKANGPNGLLTCCIRPSSIFGPGDKLLVPSLVDAARAGKSKFIIGDGKNRYDFTYVENVAHAHICAERALASKGTVSEKASGQAYFITNMEPIKFWEFVSLILEGLGYERPRIKIPALVMMPIAHLVEFTYKLLAPYGMKVPQLTPSRIRLLSCTRTFNCSKAKDRLGYTPIVSLQEGLERTIESYSHLRAEQQPKRGHSKVHSYLGSGRVADILLWRDKKQSFAVLLVLLAFYYNFIVSGHTIVAAISKLILLTAVFLYIHSKLPERIFGCTVEKVPLSAFHCSEEKSRNAAQSAVSLWNNGVGTLKSLCRGNDWKLFLKVVVILMILSFLGALSLQRIFLAGILIMFVAFYIYEKKEKEIDHLLMQATSLRSQLRSNTNKKDE